MTTVLWSYPLVSTFDKRETKFVVGGCAFNVKTDQDDVFRIYYDTTLCLGITLVFAD